MRRNFAHNDLSEERVQATPSPRVGGLGAGDFLESEIFSQIFHRPVNTS